LPIERISFLFWAFFPGLKIGIINHFNNLIIYNIGKRVKLGTPKTVTMCGSSRFVEIMAVCAWMIERDERAIVMSLHLLPSWYSREPIPHHLAEHEGVAQAMDALHFYKIDISHEIFVVNYQDYIGDSTKREIEHAQMRRKNIRWYTHDPIGEKVQKIIDKALK